QNDRGFAAGRTYAPRARSRAAARRRRAQQCVHALSARALRHHTLARGAGDAGRDHAAAEMVSVPPLQDLILAPHGDRASSGADGEDAERGYAERGQRRRAVFGAAEGARTGPESAAAEGVVVLVLSPG